MRFAVNIILARLLVPEVFGLMALGVVMAVCGSVTVFFRFQDSNFQ